VPEVTAIKKLGEFPSQFSHSHASQMMCVSTSESLNISDWGCYLDSPFVQRGKELREVLHLFTQAYLYHQLEHKEEGRL